MTSSLEHIEEMRTMRKIILVGLVLTILLALTSVTSAAPPLLKVQGSGLVVPEVNDPWPFDPYKITFSARQIDVRGNASGIVRISDSINDWYIVVDVLVLAPYGDDAEIAGVITKASNEEQIGKGFYAGLDDTDNQFFYSLPPTPEDAIEYVEIHLGGDLRALIRGNIIIR
jgi:hypothetical protein